MRRTRLMSWFFLVLSLSFFASRSFRYALEAPLAGQWWKEPPALFYRLFTLRRYVSTEQFRGMSEEAARRGDAEFTAFAALVLPQMGFRVEELLLSENAVPVNMKARLEALRLAEKAVHARRDLTWIYSFVVLSQDWMHISPGQEQELLARVDELKAFDPDNAVPDVLRADLIRFRRKRAWAQAGSSPAKLREVLAADLEWQKAMEKVYAQPRIDTYVVRRFLLIRKVMLAHGWDHPVVVATVLDQMPFPNYMPFRDYARLLVDNIGADAEAAGRMDKALRCYWQAAQFGTRMSLQSQFYLEGLTGVEIQRTAYQRLVPALKQAGRIEEAAWVSNLDQALQDLWRRPNELARASYYPWEVLLVNLTSSLAAVFFPIAFVAVLYVNAKLWVRKEKKGRLYEIMTIAENYAPLLLFSSCLGLYLAEAPFAQNFAHAMSTKEPITSLPLSFFCNSYPLWDPPYVVMIGGLPVTDPFQDLAPYTLAGIALWSAVLLALRWREHRQAARVTEVRAALDASYASYAIYLLIALTAAGLVVASKPWYAFLWIEPAVLLMVYGCLWVSLRFGRETSTAQRGPLRKVMTGAGATLLLVFLAAISGVAFGIMASTLAGYEKPRAEPIAISLALSPFLATGALAATRMRHRALALSFFGLVTLFVAVWVYRS